ncbi:MAG: tetratricopeptide repeat protein [Pseudomonadota bacterium]
MSSGGKPTIKIEADERTDGQDEVGLSWPEPYLELAPMLRDAWKVRGEIYLNRLLSGKSGALVYAADLTSRGFTGQAILKLDRIEPDDWSEEKEYERHARVFEAAPDFSAKHLPKIVDVLQAEDQVAILSTIAGRGLEYAIPWADCTYKRELLVARRLASDLLESWNKDYELVDGMLAPQHLLEQWLGYRLDPKKGRIHEFLGKYCGLDVDEPSLNFNGTWYPNPLAFAKGKLGRVEKLRMRAIRGHQHSDLHGYNVLVSTGPSNKTDYFLIDLAMYEDRQFLFYDHAYFEIAHLLRIRDWATPDRWRSILVNLRSNRTAVDEHSLKGDDLGLIQVIHGMRKDVRKWIDRHEPNRLSYLESQMLLARVAAGLNFVHKRVPDRWRIMALIYAAANLGAYIKLHGIDWPKNGPEVLLPELNESIEPAQAAPTYPELPDKPSIAVMAFENLSGETEQEYFADGISEEIITELSRIDWLMVIGRGSTFAYKGTSTSPRQVAKELGVRYVVQGSVRKAGNRVRISVQLNDASHGAHVWAERYESDLDDIFALEDEIARAIVANIDSELQGAERELAHRKLPENKTAWDLYQHALWHFFRFSREDDERARELAMEALAQAPKFGPPHAVLSFINTRELILGLSETPFDSIKSALDHAERAVRADPGDSFAQSALARVYMLSGKNEEAISTFETAVGLNPSSFFAHFGYGSALLWAGHTERALAMLHRAQRLSPKDPLMRFNLFVQAVAQYLAENFSESERLARQALTQPAAGPFGNFVLAMALAGQNRVEEARAAVAEGMRFRPNFSISRVKLITFNLEPNFRKRVIESFRLADLPEESPEDPSAGPYEQGSSLEKPDRPTSRELAYPSIAVLPFVNTSGDPEDEPLCDGITEDIISQLSQFRSLIVVSRTSSFSYKGTTPKAQTVGRELKARYLVEGSLRRAKHRIRITAQLIEATSGKQLWSERYDREFKDIFALQDDITQMIVSAIEPELANVERWRASTDSQAVANSPWGNYQCGLWYLYQFKQETNVKARKHFERASDLSPAFAPARAGLAYVLFQDVINGHSEDIAKHIEEAYRAARHAVELDAKDAMAHMVLGRIQLLRRNYDASVAQLEIAIKLNRNYADAYNGLGFTFTFSGRPREAIEQFAQALRISPNNPHVWSFHEIRAVAHIFLEEYDEALIWAQKAVRMHNYPPFSLATYSCALAMLERLPEAKEAVDELLNRQPEFTVAFAANYNYFNKVPEHLERYLEGIRRAGIPE